MPSASQIDTAIRQVSEAFAQELARLRAKLAKSYSWRSDVIELQVIVSDQGRVKFQLEYRGESTVHAATLGTLMDEVYRRAGFDDREQGRLQAASDALISLPAPGSQDQVGSVSENDEIPF